MTTLQYEYTVKNFTCDECGEFSDELSAGYCVKFNNSFLEGNIFNKSYDNFNFEFSVIFDKWKLN